MSKYRKIKILNKNDANDLLSRNSEKYKFYF